ncbi:MAG TPA: FAD:protein FMN transferase [Ilumatobacteraceae bacterium]|nr:FAD:protein FMN transferase [Ilumatobacteraceae bacterium]
MSLHHVEAVMGTSISIDVVDSHDRSLIDELVAWFHQVDAEFSPFKEDSTVTRIGRGELAPTDEVVSDDMREVLQRCGELDAETGGVFDVWSLPSPNGTRFNPCGYVKGWSVERAAHMLQAAGVRDYCINAGGDIALGGRDHDNRPWRVGVRHPAAANGLAFVLQLDGTNAVATSGSYERGAHIYDPRRGEATTTLASATVVGPDLAEADAYATTIYVMGIDGLQWLSERPGYSGCLITSDLQLLTTDEFDRHLVR